MTDAIIHYAIAQTYDGVREDGKRVSMTPIACQMTRVFLPKGHKATHSDKVTCKKCIEALIELYAEAINDMNVRLENLSIDHDTEFMISKRERANREFNKWAKNYTTDRETLERLKR